ILITDIRTTQHTQGVYYIERELSSQGYSCIIHNTGRNQQNWIHYVQELSQRKIEALILMGSIYQSDAMKEAIGLYLPSVPVVICNGYFTAPNVYGILSDEQSGVTECVKLLQRAGCRRPAFLMNASTPSNEQKKLGFLNGMAQFYPNEEPLALESGISVEENAASTREMLLAHPDIDGIVFSDDNMAVVGLRTLTDLHLRVPEDVQIVGINNSRFAQLSIPSLTSLDNMLYDLSMTAVHHVLSLLAGERVSKRTLIGTEVVARESTRALPTVEPPTC
ncbi:MAG: LacI family DNA-binding transcriptional regulator, partial [Clostridia bacterium]|nr:LacI family DNA-binding transcriptional regulator [Clostridia bacterium]